MGSRRDSVRAYAAYIYVYIYIYIHVYVETFIGLGV